MNTDTQSFQPENSNPALGLQGITTSLYVKPKHHGQVEATIATLAFFVITIVLSGFIYKGLD